MANSGYSDADAGSDRTGFDVVTGRAGRMIDLGVIDAAEVVAGALAAAVDTTRQFLALP